MVHTYRVTFVEGTTNEQITEMVERIKGTLSADFTTALPTYTLETERQPMDLFCESIIDTYDLIAWVGENI